MYQTNGGKVMNNQNKAINTFQRYLSVWVLLCMAMGVLIGHFVPAIPATLGKFQISGISIPIAVLIWVMIYPMMMKVDFQSIKQIGKNPKGLLVTWVTNWLIKPFTMYGIAWESGKSDVFEKENKKMPAGHCGLWQSKAVL